MNKLLADEKFDFISENDKEFIVAFNNEMLRAGYMNNGIQPYVVFGKYKIEYCKARLKTKKYVARIYFRDKEIVLRLYFSNINTCRDYIEKAPDFIKKPFINNHSKCKGCDANGGGMISNTKCRYKKSYIIDSETYIKCAEQAFMFENPAACNAIEYVNLITAFYPDKSRNEVILQLPQI